MVVPVGGPCGGKAMTKNQRATAVQLLLERGRTLSNPDVAAASVAAVTSATIDEVRALRLSLGVPVYTGRGWGKRGGADYSSVDWSLPVRAIAELLGRDYSTVAAEKRRRFGPVPRGRTHTVGGE